jgi:hypothetical protein
VTPLTIGNVASLEVLHAALVERRYQGDIAQSGWGGLEDGEDRLGRRSLSRAPGGDPTLVSDPRRGPKRVEARLYFDEYDSALAKQSDNEIPTGYLYISNALDVVFVEVEEGVAALASGSTAVIKRTLIPALRALKVGDTPPTVALGRPQGNVDPDLFLWLVSRYNNQSDAGARDLHAQLSLSDLRGLNAADVDDRNTRMYKEAVITRATVQAAITEAGSALGPVTLAVDDELFGLHADFTLRQDGGFSVQKGESYYYVGVGPTMERYIPRYLVDDVAFGIMPRIEKAHADDREWHESGRIAFMRRVRAMQNAPLSLGDAEETESGASG